jgi:hypothetical protein
LLVLFFNRQFEHFSRIDQTGLEFVQGSNDRFQPRALTPKRLGFFRVTPDVRVFEFPADLF